MLGIERTLENIWSHAEKIFFLKNINSRSIQRDLWAEFFSFKIKSQERIMFLNFNHLLNYIEEQWWEISVRVEYSSLISWNSHHIL